MEFGTRATLPYYEEIKQTDKTALDKAVLIGMGLDEGQTEDNLPELYEEYLKLVNDRLIKAGKSMADRVERFNENEEVFDLKEEDSVD